MDSGVAAAGSLLTLPSTIYPSSGGETGNTVAFATSGDLLAGVSSPAGTPTSFEPYLFDETGTLVSDSSVPVTSGSPVPHAVPGPAGSMYVAYSYTAQLSIPNTSGGSIILTPFTAGKNSVALLQLNASGQVMASLVAGDANGGDAKVQALGVTPTGDIVIAGTFSGGLSFGGTPATPLKTSGNTDYDVFVAQLTLGSATFNATKEVFSFGGAGADAATSISIDPKSGIVYVAGTTSSQTMTNTNISNLCQGTVTTGEPASPGAGFGGFVVQYDTNFNAQWCAFASGATGAVCDVRSVAADPNGGVVVGGRFEKTISFAGNGGASGLPANGLYSPFLWSLDSSLKNRVVAQYSDSTSPATSASSINSVVIDGASNVIAGGYFAGVATFFPGVTATPPAQQSGFVFKANVSLQPIWLQSYGGNYDDSIAAVALNPAGTDIGAVGTVDGVSSMCSAGETTGTCTAGYTSFGVSTVEAALILQLAP